MGGGLAPYAVVLIVPGLTTLGLLMGSRTRMMPLLSVGVMALLMVHLVVLNFAMYVPLFTIIQGVGERTN